MESKTLGKIFAGIALVLSAGAWYMGSHSINGSLYLSFAAIIVFCIGAYYAFVKKDGAPSDNEEETEEDDSEDDASDDEATDEEDTTGEEAPEDAAAETDEPAEEAGDDSDDANKPKPQQ